jgi:putative transcriptional regulator
MTIRIHLSRLMGEHKLKIADLQRATELPRSLLTAMYNEEAQRIDLEAIEKICLYFKCPVSSLLELSAAPVAAAPASTDPA